MLHSISCAASVSKRIFHIRWLKFYFGYIIPFIISLCFYFNPLVGKFSPFLSMYHSIKLDLTFFVGLWQFLRLISFFLIGKHHAVLVKHHMKLPVLKLKKMNSAFWSSLINLTWLKFLRYLFAMGLLFPSLGCGLILYVVQLIYWLWTGL